jgi:glycogen debranching enzyme
VNDTATDDDDRYQILAASSLTLSGARVLKHGDTFAVFDRHGDIRPYGIEGAQGLYHEGTRFLSALRVRLGGQRPLLLSSTVREDNILLGVDSMNPDLTHAGQVMIPHGTIHVLRSKFLWRGTSYEHLQISNYGASAVDVVLAVAFAADFVDVFEVRGTRRERRGTLHPADISHDAVTLSYTGLDGDRRCTRLHFAPAPDICAESQASFQLHLEAAQSKDVYLTVSCESWTDRPSLHRAFEHAHGEACTAMRRHASVECSIHTSNEQFNDWLNRSISDLRMMITDTPEGPFPYAGVPWFSAPFGRDAIITALEALWFNPQLALGVLSFLAATQADAFDAEADAEPGKIVHEMRSGEMARLREIPFGRYYGSVDSTPLFVLLASAYHEVSGDTASIERLWPHIDRALEWIVRHGDLDGDGFVEYGRRSKSGLLHQGWKDSQDSVFHADGTPAQGPIALCEVQGYVYAAQQGAARLAEALGMPDRARVLRSRADELRGRFDQAFWCEDLGTFALALDGAKRPCRVRSSNAGQTLFTGIVLPERAPPLAEQLLTAEMFSGWGIRTVASGEHRYNPMSYHNGSVWPHDNALIAWGLARYGMREQALSVMTALFDASLFVDLNRLPELSCGFTRRHGEGPTLYPVACSPQSWVAAAPLLLLRAALGMTVEGGAKRVRFDRPALPPFLEAVTIKKLRVGPEGSVDLDLRRHPDDVGVNIAGRHGPARVEVIAVK